MRVYCCFRRSSLISRRVLREPSRKPESTVWCRDEYKELTSQRRDVPLARRRKEIRSNRTTKGGSIAGKARPLARGSIQGPTSDTVPEEDRCVGLAVGRLLISTVEYLCSPTEGAVDPLSTASHTVTMLRN
jgi:hypothetical protein